MFFRWHLVICHLISDIWWGILNSYITREWSAFLWIFQKNYKLGEAETHRLHHSQYDATPSDSEEQHRPFKKTGTTTIFLFGYQSCTSKFSGRFCRKIPCSDCNTGINLIVILEYTFVQVVQTENKSPRFRKCRRSYALFSVVVQINHCQIPTHFFAWCALFAVVIFSFFCSCLSLTRVHLRNLFLLSTPVAQMLLTPR